MGHDDYFNNRGHGQRNDHGHYREEHDDHHDDHDDMERYRQVFEKVTGNKKLLLVLAIIAVLGIVLVVGAVTLLIPFIAKGFDAVQKSGIKGLLEMATPFLEQLWSGSGK